MKTPLNRKLENEELLVELGIPINEHLPIIESEEETEIRKADEIARRILVLGYLNMVVEGGDKNQIIEYFKKSNLWKDASPSEKKLLEEDEITEQEKIEITWQSEAMWLMLWAIKKIEKLELPTRQCEVKEIVENLPNFLGDFEAFTEEAETRNKSEILDQSDLIYRLHWSVRYARRNKKKMPANLDEGVVQEWHRAINWITNYEGLDWDEVTTDT